MNVKPYDFVLNLGILRKSHVGTYSGICYAILNALKKDDGFSPLFHHLSWYQLEDEGSYDALTYFSY